MGTCPLRCPANRKERRGKADRRREGSITWEMAARRGSFTFGAPLLYNLHTFTDDWYRFVLVPYRKETQIYKMKKNNDPKIRREKRKLSAVGYGQIQSKTTETRSARVDS